MSLQRPTTGVCHALLRIPTQSGTACSAEVSRTKWPLCTMWFGQFTKNVTKMGHKDRRHPHLTKHNTQPIAYLISKQVVPYRTRGGTCCPGGSTPEIQSLTDSSMTSRIT
jgi:hypothetical protein